MSQPSAEAIRKLKLQLEKKKLEQQQRFVQQKLSTIEHRAAQGDRKAKKMLKEITEAKQREKEKPPQTEETVKRIKLEKQAERTKPSPIVTPKKPLSFDELMKIAKGEKPNPSAIKPKLATTQPAITKPMPTKPISHQTSKTHNHETKPKHALPDSAKRTKEQKTVHHSQTRKIPSAPTPRSSHQNFVLPRPPVQRTLPPAYRGHNNRYDDEDEDEYEYDDFVVDEEEENPSDISNTIRSLFRYDKSKCDRREAILDAQAERLYRSIGQVKSFEDLEREERRSARQAALEDRREERAEEERKAAKRKLKAQMKRKK